MAENGLRPPATTIEALDAHLYHLQRSVETTAATMEKKIDAIAGILDGFVTRPEFEALEERVRRQSPGNAFDNMLSLITRIGGAFAVIMATIAGVAALVHYVDRFPKP